VGTQRCEGVATYCIAILETEVKILDIEVQVRKNELLETKEGGAGHKSQLEMEKERSVEGTVLLHGSSSK
jgi:hypothetical protein